MDRIKWIAFLLFVYSCQKQIIKLDKPIDNKEIIEEVKKQPIPEPVKQRTVQALTSCEDYSKKAYEIVTQNQKQIDDLKAENQALMKRIAELESELAPWRTIKLVGLISLIGLVVFAVVKVYLKLKPI
jgi:hypothetical protein